MKYYTTTALAVATILTPLHAEDPVQANYNKATTKSDALEVDDSDNTPYKEPLKSVTALDTKDPVKARYEKTLTESDALETHAKPLVNLMETAEKNESFATFTTAVQAAGLTEYLSAITTEATVFIPNDEAFEALPDGTLGELLKPENKDKLISTLKYHIIPERAPAADIQATDYKTLNGSNLTVVKPENGEVMVNDANVIATDLFANNGVIHTIDEVLIPES